MIVLGANGQLALFPITETSAAHGGTWLHPPVVPSAARVTGAVADAVVTVDRAEHARRVSVGLGGVDELGLLDALMCLPAGVPIPVRDVGEVARWHLRNAPPGCVEWLPEARLRRLLVPACSVELVVVGSATWRSGLRRAAEFEPFATRIVQLTRRPRQLTDIEWEADAAGVGVWIPQPDGQLVELVAPTPFMRHYVKPAGWRFTERAYVAWLLFAHAMDDGLLLAPRRRDQHDQPITNTED